MMNFLRRPIGTTLKGFLVLLPVVVVLALVFWLVFTLESLLGRLVIAFAGDRYVPGMGIGLGVVLSFAVGVVMNAGLAQRILDRWEHLLRRIPFIKTVYGAIQDLASLLSKEQRNRYNRVVLVTLGDTGAKLLGFVTRDDLEMISPGASASMVAVYLPMSYQIGGYLALVPRANVEPVAMSVEDASRLILTAAVSVGETVITPPAPR